MVSTHPSSDQVTGSGFKSRRECFFFSLSYVTASGKRQKLKSFVSTKFDLFVNDGKGRLNFSRHKNKGKHRSSEWGITEHKKEEKIPSVHPPGWFRRTEKYAANCSPMYTFQSAK